MFTHLAALMVLISSTKY